jgi:pyruvate/2-oxoglutarate dehydrogenase complex dihydrolipoamide dehydrogenase (E3) component
VDRLFAFLADIAGGDQFVIICGMEVHQTFPQLESLDDFNERLLGHVHPHDWVNPEPADRYNLVVIGGGTAGLVTAAGAAGLGAKVAIVERELLGGDCLNVGCVPSKALIRSARAAADMRRAADLGVRAPSCDVDFAVLMQRMRRLRAEISPHDSAARFRDLGIDVYYGGAQFSGPTTVAVGDHTLRFARACIATGSRPSVPGNVGLSETGYVTNETIFSLTELPRRLAVIGAGPIGCELAQAFARFGSEVTLIESAHGVLPREDPEASEIVKQSLLKDGIQLRCCGKQLQTARIGSERRLTIESHGEHHKVIVDEILVAVGRSPNTESLGLEAAGVEFDQDGVQVNDFLQTSNRRIYAAGDVCSRYKFTHSADALARIVIQNALFFGRQRASRLIIPWCTYTDPELAHVGINPQLAHARGIKLDTLSIPLVQVDRAVLDGEAEGLLKIHLQKGKDTILGATLVSRHAGETISQLTLAMVANAGMRTLASTIHPYPTQAEAIKKAADAYNRTRLTPRLKKLFESVMRWRR